eukprot:1187482-Prorocentrum_minimum.AAC.1
MAMRTDSAHRCCIDQRNTGFRVLGFISMLIMLRQPSPPAPAGSAPCLPPPPPRTASAAPR